MQLDLKPKVSRSRISMTPLIDIVFILLIFFVLETNFIAIGELMFPLAETPKNEVATTETTALELQLFSADKIWVDGEQLTLEDLPGFLVSKQVSSDTDIILQMPNYVEMQLVVTTMDVLRKKDLHKIQLRPVEP